MHEKFFALCEKCLCEIDTFHTKHFYPISPVYFVSMTEKNLLW